MNEEQLDKLLKSKELQSFSFGKDKEEFLSDFLTETRKTSALRQNILRIAALFAIAAGIAIFAADFFKTPKEFNHPIYESLRLFGNDSAVMFIGNELVTGERITDETPSNIIGATLEDNIELKLACADNDSILVNMPGVSGNVIVSRCDARTLVLDIDLLIDGKRISTQIPVERNSRRNRVLKINS